MASGRRLGEQAELCDASQSWLAYEAPDGVAAMFARLVDYVRDFVDCAGDCPEVTKLGMFADLQGFIDELAALGATLAHAMDTPLMRFGPPLGGDPIRVRILYLGAFPTGAVPEIFAIPRDADIRLE